MSANNTYFSDCDEKMKDLERLGMGTVMAPGGSSVDVLKMLHKTQSLFFT